MKYVRYVMEKENCGLKSVQKKLAIDGDLIAYPAAAVNQTVYYIAKVDGEGMAVSASIRQLKETFGKDVELDHTIQANPLGFVTHTMDRTITNILDATGTTDFEIFLSEGPCFRHNLATLKPYKGNRDKMIRPLHLKAAKEYLKERWGAVSWPWLEADDCVSIKAHEEGSVVCSYDKDLDQIPGWHFDFNKGDLYYIDEERAAVLLYTQVLMGDVSDNIPGLPGIGKKRAAALIKKFRTASSDEDEFWKHLHVCTLEYYTKVLGPDNGEKQFEENFKLIRLLSSKEEYEKLQIQTENI